MQVGQEIRPPPTFGQLWIKEFDPSIYFAYQRYLEDQGFEYLGSGSFRVGYRRSTKGGHVVIKVPYTYQGFNDNIIEAWAYRKFRRNADTSDGFVYAPCRLLPNVCLMMVYIERYRREDLPEWTYKIDGRQCGWFQGRAVAYDSAYNVSADIVKEAFQWAGLSENNQPIPAIMA